MTTLSQPAWWRSSARAVAALGLFMLAGGSALAQDYPARPVKLVVPFGAGGAVDVVARMLGADLSKRLGQPVVVENRTGAGGNIAASFVAKSDPDGYTLLMGSTGNAVNGSLYSNLNYNPDKDLAPVALVGQVPTVLLAHPSVPARTLPELVALAKGNSAKLNLAHGGAGTTEHLAAEMFNARAGVKLPVIAYRGGAPAMNDLLAGHVQLFFTNQLNALPHLKSGGLKAIALAAGERSASLPNVPTFAEQGMPDFVVSVWWGVFGPANMPQPVVRKLNEAINAALNSPEVIEKLTAVGATPLPGSPEQFSTFYARESAKWSAVVRAANIKPD